MTLLIRVNIDPKKVNGDQVRLMTQALKDIMLDLHQGKTDTTAGGVGYDYTFKIQNDK